jgi:hypothetical protein
MTEWIKLGVAVGNLVIAGFALWYLIKYAGYTRVIAEATSKPAVIAVHRGDITNAPRLRNIGSGPALDVEWAVSGTKKVGKISYIEAAAESVPLEDVKLTTLQHGAVQSGTNKVAITCSYRSISGKETGSVNEYDFARGLFSSSFTDLPTL